MNMSKKNQNKKNKKRVIKEWISVASTPNSVIVRTKKYMYSVIKDKDEIKKWISQIVKKMPHDEHCRYAIYLKHTQYVIINAQIIEYRPIRVLNVEKPQNKSVQYDGIDLRDLLKNSEFLNELKELIAKYSK